MESAGLDLLVGAWLRAGKEIIEQHHGNINKYLGDGFLAYWPESAISPQEITAVVTSLKELQQKKAPEFRFVLHFGPVAIGGIASMGEESLMGKEVNLTFRLEKLAGSLGEYCGLSETAQARLGEHLPVRSLGQHALKGFEGKAAFFGGLEWSELLTWARCRIRRRNGLSVGRKQGEQFRRSRSRIL